MGRGAELGYQSAWTPAAGPGEGRDAFQRCLDWHRATGLTTGISVVPADRWPPEVLAGRAREVWEATGGRFVLGVGSGRLPRPASQMPGYLDRLRQHLGPDGPPVYLAALGPRMLEVAGRAADGVALNWCTREQVAASRRLVEESARAAGRATPPLAEYIRVCVAPDEQAALVGLARAALGYALGPRAYRHHFERMGLGAELARLDAMGAAGAGIDELAAAASPEMLRRVGGFGRPGEVGSAFQRLAEGLDVAIVRVVLPVPGDRVSARLALEEFAPARR